jgi:recombination protein RecA
VDIRRISAIKDGDQVVGSRTKIKVVKNKVAAPFREAEFDIMYGEGISREGDALDLAVAQNIVDKSGAWFSYKNERIGQGRENSKTYLREHPEMFKEIDGELRKRLGLVATAEKAAAAANGADGAAAPPPPPAARPNGAPVRPLMRKEQ